MDSEKLLPCDHERIWLEPECCADTFNGRTWCQDNVWPSDDCPHNAKATEYVRADLASPALNEDLVEAARNLCDSIEQEEATNGSLSAVLMGDCRALRSALSNAETGDGQ